MQIITIEDQDFPDLLELFQTSNDVGQFKKNGRVQTVRANNRLVMISLGDNPEKIAIRPVRGQGEAVKVAKRLLEREAELGHKVEITTS